MIEKVKLNGINVKMEIDTGTDATVISKRCYNEKF